MKKITLLFAFLITSIGFSQTELLTNGDFENGTAPWVGNNFSVVAGEAFISSTNAGGNLWDTQLVHGGLAFVNAQEYTLTFWARAAADRNITVAIQNVGIWDDQFRQDFALTTTMTEYTATFNATSDNGNVQIGFLMAGTTSTDAIYYDDISLVDVPADPLNDATLSDLTVDGTTVTGFAAGTLSYNVEIPEGTTVVPTVVGTPTQSSPATAVTTDATGLPGASTVLVTAQDGNTTETYTVNFNFPSTNTPCAGTSTDAVAGTFTYNYSFVTSGTDVTITFEVVETFTGLVGQLKEGTSFTGMTNTGGQTFEITLTGQVIGTDLTFAFYGPYAGAALETIEYTYTVGDDCTLGLDDLNAAKFNVYPNPSNNVWNIQTNNTIINSVQVFDMLGKQVLSLNPRSAEAQIDASTLNIGLYFVRIESNSGIKTIKLIKN